MTAHKPETATTKMGWADLRRRIPDGGNSTSIAKEILEQVAKYAEQYPDLDQVVKALSDVDQSWHGSILLDPTVREAFRAIWRTAIEPLPPDKKIEIVLSKPDIFPREFITQTIVSHFDAATDSLLAAVTAVKFSRRFYTFEPDLEESAFGLFRNVVEREQDPEKRLSLINSVFKGEGHFRIFLSGSSYPPHAYLEPEFRQVLADIWNKAIAELPDDQARLKWIKTVTPLVESLTFFSREEEVNGKKVSVVQRHVFKENAYFTALRIADAFQDPNQRLDIYTYVVSKALELTQDYKNPVLLESTRRLLDLMEKSFPDPEDRIARGQIAIKAMQFHPTSGTAPWPRHVQEEIGPRVGLFVLNAVQQLPDPARRYEIAKYVSDEIYDSRVKGLAQNIFENCAAEMVSPSDQIAALIAEAGAVSSQASSMRYPGPSWEQGGENYLDRQQASILAEILPKIPLLPTTADRITTLSTVAGLVGRAGKEVGRNINQMWCQEVSTISDPDQRLRFAEVASTRDVLSTAAKELWYNTLRDVQEPDTRIAYALRAADRYWSHHDKDRGAQKWRMTLEFNDLLIHKKNNIPYMAARAWKREIQKMSPKDQIDQAIGVVRKEMPDHYRHSGVNPTPSRLYTQAMKVLMRNCADTNVEVEDRSRAFSAFIDHLHGTRFFRARRNVDRFLKAVEGLPLTDEQIKAVSGFLDHAAFIQHKGQYIMCDIKVTN